MHYWDIVIKRMEKSGRFSDKFIKTHILQRVAVDTFLISSNNKKPQEQKNIQCRKYYEITEPQVRLSRNINELPYSHLEESFPLPLSVIFGNEKK